LGLVLAVLWFEGGMASAINLGVFTSTLQPAPAHRFLEIVLLVGQLLTWAMAVCLGRALFIYLLRQARRLVLPALPPSS